MSYWNIWTGDSIRPEKNLSNYRRKSVNFLLDFCEYQKYIVFMVKKKNKMGRPPLKAKDKRTALTTLRLKPSEHEKLLEDAKAAGLSLSSYLLKCWKKDEV